MPSAIEGILQEELYSRAGLEWRSIDKAVAEADYSLDLVPRRAQFVAQPADVDVD
jgi:hypothetical protein